MIPARPRGGFVRAPRTRSDSCACAACATADEGCRSIRMRSGDNCRSTPRGWPSGPDQSRTPASLAHWLGTRLWCRLRRRSRTASTSLCGPTKSTWVCTSASADATSSRLTSTLSGSRTPASCSPIHPLRRCSLRRGSGRSPRSTRSKPCGRCATSSRSSRLLVLSLRVVKPDLGRGSALRLGLVLSLPALLLNPVLVTVGFGQVNLVVTLLVMWDLLSSRRIGKMAGTVGHRDRARRRGQADAAPLRALPPPHAALPRRVQLHRSRSWRASS